MPTPRPVVSRHHPFLKEFRAAFRTAPEESGKLAIEGPRLLGEALRSGWKIEKVLFSETGHAQHGPKLLTQFSKHVAVAVVEDDLFRACAEVEQPQGVAALLALQVPELQEICTAQRADGAPPLLVVAAGLQDPGNMGTLLRSADAFGATAFIALAGTVSPWNAKAVRASAGSGFHLPVLSRLAVADFLAACRLYGVAILSSAARAKLELDAVDFRRPLCLVLGQEASGVPREILRASEATVAIPMQREVESLNAGVAGAILLYEAARQRARNDA